MPDDIENIAEPVLDTGQWRAEMRRLLNELIARDAEQKKEHDEQKKEHDKQEKEYVELCAKVKAVADAIDAEHKQWEQIHRRQAGFIKIWAWAKNVSTHAAEEAKKIRIE
jgi:ATP phosphoribosyltransferase regulatory subunit HisZ